MLYVRAVATLGALAVAVSAQDAADLNVVHRIKVEALKKGQTAAHLRMLSDRYGPRLTASPEYDAAAEWVMTKAREWGLANVGAEKWGPFGRAWSLRRFSLHMTAPQYAPLVGLPLAWSSSTNGVVTAEPVLVPIRDNDMERFEADLAKVRKQHAGKLKGRIVMVTAPRQLELQLQPRARRYADADLSGLAVAPVPNVPSERKFDYSRLAEPEEPELRTEFTRNAPPAFREALSEKRKELRRRLHEFLRAEGAVAVFTSDRRSDGGHVFGESAGWYEAKYPSPLLVITLTPEHYGRIARLVEGGSAVRLEFEVKAEISASDVEPANVIAEIPGGAKAGELVLVGAHLDSWHGGTGATDNAAGCAVAMEAMRILKALNLKLDRTVRMVLWSGEEQGLHGSKQYVKRHFGDRATMQLKPAHETVSAYFNLDNGSGKIRGVYLQSNDAARPVFERWLAPFRDLGVTTISIRDTFGTDHLSFDAVGLPGFQFIQDPLEYSSRTHHSTMDVYDHTQPADLMQAAAVMASVIYHAANRPEKMPRKPLPDPEPAWTPGAASTSGGQ
jgi:carboxypeptidase Q